MEQIENRAFDEIQPGDTASLVRTLTYKDIEVFAIMSAVVHPLDTPSSLGAVEAAWANLIRPILVGPEPKIRAASAQAGLDLSPYEIVTTEHSEATAVRAVAMARVGKVKALMKGALHTDELMHAVVNDDLGLRTDRRVSYVFAIDAPGYPRPLFVTDAAINISPTPADKRDIIQNAIELAHSLGIPKPPVAILSAVETVTESIRSTLDAAAHCKMADRGQITGGILDGPLAFDMPFRRKRLPPRVVVAHLGGGASMCAMDQRNSVATTMALPRSMVFRWAVVAATWTLASFST